MAELPADVNERIAEWCERKLPLTERYHFRRGPDKQAAAWRSPKGFWVIPSSASRDAVSAYNFRDDLNACARFEALLEERGLWLQYEEDLCFVLHEADRVQELLNKGNGDVRRNRHDRFWRFAFATATAAQRCAALLRVIEEVKS